MGDTPILPDEMLIAAIERAVSRGVEPAQVEAEVGQRAWVNTIRSADRLALNTANIGPDEGTDKTLPSLRSARAVVYWGRPVGAHDPRIVGIVWSEDGSVEMFFGVLYPP